EIDINKEKTKMVKFRILLIDILVKDAIDTFLTNLGSIQKGKFKDELVSKKNNSLLSLLKDLNWKLVIKQREVQAVELAGESVITGLLSHFVESFINYKDDKSVSANKAEKLFGQ